MIARPCTRSCSPSLFCVYHTMPARSTVRASYLIRAGHLPFTYIHLAHHAPIIIPLGLPASLSCSLHSRPLPPANIAWSNCVAPSLICPSLSISVSVDLQHARLVCIAWTSVPVDAHLLFDFCQLQTGRVRLFVSACDFMS